MPFKTFEIITQPQHWNGRPPSTRLPLFGLHCTPGVKRYLALDNQCDALFDALDNTVYWLDDLRLNAHRALASFLSTTVWSYHAIADSFVGIPKLRNYATWKFLTRRTQQHYSSVDGCVLSSPVRSKTPSRNSTNDSTGLTGLVQNGENVLGVEKPRRCDLPCVGWVLEFLVFSVLLIWLLWYQLFAMRAEDLLSSAAKTVFKLLTFFISVLMLLLYNYYECQS